MPRRVRKRKSHFQSITLCNGNQPKRKHFVYKTLQRLSANLFSKQRWSPNKPGNPNQRLNSEFESSIHDSRRLRKIQRKHIFTNNLHPEHGQFKGIRGR